MNRQELNILSRRLKNLLVQRFILFYMLYLGAGAGGFACVYLYYHSRIWYGTERFYSVVHFVENLMYPLLLVYVTGGALAMGIVFLRRACRYLDEFLAASEQLLYGGEREIIFSEELEPMALYLDTVREKIRESQRAAREAEQRKNDLVVYLAHDLKTPLTSVIGYLTLLTEEEEISAGLQKKYLGVALEKALRLEDLINEFFEITRFSLTHLTLELSEINLTRMLEQTTFEFQPMFADKGLTCELDAPSDFMYLCDPDKLQRVFDNLLRNAVSYSYVDTAVHIALKEEEPYLTVTVENAGHTIIPEKLERIFDQFFRLDAARGTGSGGAGLGLAIAKEIVELHKGTITAQSENDRIVFTVRLPLHYHTEKSLIKS